jgi:hypothetical protein
MQIARISLRLAFGFALAGGSIAPLAAADQDSTQVSGDLARACIIDYDCGADDRCLSLELDNRTTAQDTALVTWQCNYAVGSATMEFKSENLGVLKNDTAPGDTGLPYRASYTGGDNSGFSLLNLDTTVRTNPTPSTPNVDIQGYIQLRLEPRAAPLFAGIYTDRITVTITPDGP